MMTKTTLKSTHDDIAARGDVCAHTHLYSGLAPLGMPAPEPPPDSFVQILERVWWRLDRALDAEALRASARYYIAESLLAGTTTFIDHHESPNLIDGSLDILADAAADLGARALVCYGATERNFGPDEGRRGLEECRRFLRANRRANVMGAISLHASFTVSDETVALAGRLCDELNAVMHVHLAEDGADVADAVARGYAGPLERLMAFDALPAGSIIAHGVHLRRDQVARAADAGCWFVHNPRSNEGNRVGYARALAATDRVALGTDGWAARMGDEEAALLRLAAADGDDLAAVRRRRPASRDLARALFGAEVDGDRVARGPDGAVKTVVVAGRTLVEDGALVSGDIGRIRAEARAAADQLWARMATL